MPVVVGLINSQVESISIILSWFFNVQYLQGPQILQKPLNSIKIKFENATKAEMWTFPRPEPQGHFKEWLLLWESTVDSKVIESLPWDPTHIIY
jgi:hypothetical protein